MYCSDCVYVQPEELTTEIAIVSRQPYCRMDKLIGSDNASIAVSAFVAPVKTNTTLAGKPKIFLFQVSSVWNYYLLNITIFASVRKIAEMHYIVSFESLLVIDTVRNCLSGV